MPREMIYGDVLPFAEDSPGRSVVEVCWSREAEHVQIASKCVRADSEETYRPGTEITIDTDASLGATGVVPSVPDLTFFDGFYVQLDRPGINDLIRKLRRARDQAFGRDE